MNDSVPTILIIDDTPSARESLGDLLSIENYELLYGENGFQGIEIAERTLPDLILLDVMMPGIDGFETCRRIRQIASLEEVPVVLVTALDDKDSMVEGIKAGADDFLAKPIDRHILRLRVRTIVKLNRVKKLTQERKEKEETQKVLEEEKELGKLKSQFISTVSHEFRTPLAAINFAANFMLRYGDKLSEDKRKLKLEKILTQVARMVELLDDVLTIGKAEAGKNKLELNKYDFKTFIAPIIEEVSESFDNSHKIQFTATDQDCSVFLDERIAKDIFSNLLSNAIKFSPEKKEVELNVSKTENGITVEIKDYGIGIPKEDIESVFSPFHRGANVSTIQGTGLGLKIVKDAIELHNGQIVVESTVDSGTSFFLTFPEHK